MIGLRTFASRLSTRGYSSGVTPQGQATTPRPPALTIQQQLEGMTLTFDSQAAGDLKATLQFHLMDSGESCYLTMVDGICTFHKGVTAEPTLTIKTPSDVWQKIGRGELSGPDALRQGLYTVSGDLSLLMRLGTLFRPIHQLKYTVPDQRPAGPLALSGMQWMTVSLISWTVFWLAPNFSVPAWVAVGIPLALTALLVIYRQLYNQATLLDWSSLGFFGFATVMTFSHNAAFGQWGSVIGTLVMAIIWFASVVSGTTPVTLEYSKWGYTRAMWRYSLFIYINAALTLMWGWVLVLSAALGAGAQIMSSIATLALVLQIVRSAVFIPASNFTKQFPRRLMQNPPRDLDKAQLRLQALALLGIGIALVGAVVLWLGW
jgi:putative sterol carrier protein